MRAIGMAVLIAALTEPATKAKSSATAKTVTDTDLQRIAAAKAKRARKAAKRVAQAKQGE